MRRVRRNRYLQTWILFLLIALPVTQLDAQSGVGSEILRTVNEAVFEIVARKPPEGAVTYERELPLDLIPFHIRTDEYISVGTAFAVAEDRFLTAAHVLSLENPTLRDELFLRNLEGDTFPIKDILRYDNHRDYALVTAEGLAVAKPLPVSEDPVLNTTVLAVGNAHGEGIIVRDGLLTSRTAERIDGQWRWLRYSAAASPGNSGGPLLNADGQVLGIVTAKSESENLNFALPIAEVAPFVASDAFLRLDFTYSLPNIRSRRRVTTETIVELPAGVDQFRSRAVAIRQEVLTRSLVETLSENELSIFPADEAGQRAVLWSNPGSLFPLLVSERDDSTWQLTQPDEITSAEIKGGTLRTGKLSGDTLFQIELLPDIDVARQFADPRVLLETVLSGYRLTRNIASEEIRITSLGDPYESRWTVDQWGRRWMYGLWDIPFADYGLVFFAMPTPNGAVGIFAPVVQPNVIPFFLDFAAMINALYVSYFGTLGQWDAFFAERQWLPEFLSTATLDYAPGVSFSFGGDRIVLEFTPDLLPIGEDSSLFMLGSFKPSAEQVVLDISGLYFYAARSRNDRLSAVQHFPPASETDTNTLQTWESILNARHPYDRGSVLSGGDTHILAPLAGQNLAEEPNSVWTIGISLGGDVPRQTMEDRFSLLEEAVTLQETEIADLQGELTFVRPVAVASRPVSELENIPSAATMLKPAVVEVAPRVAQAAPPVERVETGRLEAERQGGKSAVYRALEEGAIPRAEQLIAAGAPLGTVSDTGYTELLLALELGATDAARMIIARRPPVFERTTATGESALMLAARHSRELVPLLLSLGSSVNLRARDGNTPLHHAVLAADEVTVLRLLRAGADPDATNEAGETPRALATGRGRALTLPFESY